MSLLSYLVHPAMCLGIGISAFIYWCVSIARCSSVDISQMPFWGVPFLISKHRLATVRFPLDAVALYLLSVIFISHYAFNFSFSDLELVPNLASNLTTAVGAGVVEAFIGICTQLGALSELKNDHWENKN